MSDKTVINTYRMFKTVMAIIICAIVVLAIIFYPRYIPLWEFNPGEVGIILLGLFVLALIIERVAEAIVTVWRDPLADTYKTDVDNLEAKIKKVSKASVGKTIEEKEEAGKILSEYKAVTKTLALCLTFFLGVIVSAIGIRALQPLVDMSVFKYLPTEQRVVFSTVDIVITGGLIGGGSKGMHHIVEAVLNTFQWYRAFAQEKKAKHEQGTG